YPNIQCIQAALWNHSNGVSFGAEASKDSFTVVGAAGAPTSKAASINLKDVLAPLRPQGIDILKIDIEGSEVEVLNFMKSEDIHPRVLVVELHDRMRNGCTKALEEYLSGQRFARSKVYEYDVVDFR